MGHVIVNNIIESASKNEVIAETIVQDPNTGDWLISGNIIRNNSPHAAIEITPDNKLYICGREVLGRWMGFAEESDYDQDQLWEEYNETEG